MSAFEKTPLKSKKFVAFAIMEVTWKIILVMIILLSGLDFWSTIVIAAIITAVMAIELYYLGGQAALDKAVRLAEVNTGFARDTITQAPKDAFDIFVDEPEEGEEDS